MTPPETPDVRHVRHETITLYTRAYGEVMYKCRTCRTLSLFAQVSVLVLIDGDKCSPRCRRSGAPRCRCSCGGRGHGTEPEAADDGCALNAARERFGVWAGRPHHPNPNPTKGTTVITPDPSVPLDLAPPVEPPDRRMDHLIAAANVQVSRPYYCQHCEPTMKVISRSDGIARTWEPQHTPECPDTTAEIELRP